MNRHDADDTFRPDRDRDAETPETAEFVRRLRTAKPRPAYVSVVTSLETASPGTTRDFDHGGLPFSKRSRTRWWSAVAASWLVGLITGAAGVHQMQAERVQADGPQTDRVLPREESSHSLVKGDERARRPVDAKRDSATQHESSTKQEVEPEEAESDREIAPDLEGLSEGMFAELFDPVGLLQFTGADGDLRVTGTLRVRPIAGRFVGPPTDGRGDILSRPVARSTVGEIEQSEPLTPTSYRQQLSPLFGDATDEQFN